MEAADQPRFRTLIALPFGLALTGTILYAAWGIAEGWRYAPATDVVYDAVFVLAGMACLGRAIVSPRLRLAWVAFGVGLIGWGAGDAYWTNVLSDMRPRDVPYPSLADALYLLAPLAFFVGIPLLIRDRVGRFTAASLLDAAIGALAAAAVGTAILAPALVGLDRGDTATVATNLAYPLLDIALVAMIGGALILSGPRGVGSLLLVGLGLLIWAGADIHYLFVTATGSYEAAWIDITWPAGAVTIAAGALVRPARPPVPGERSDRVSLVLPAVFTLMAVTALVWDHFDRLRGVSVWLAAATLIAVAIRLGLAHRENDRLLGTLHSESVTDPLTGLGNRRCLFTRLERALADTASRRRGFVFALFDLDGFKAYNDAFGHPAGDALLRRVGHNLRDAVAPRGEAYRLGGDEFCVLAELGSRRPAAVVEAARAALTEEGEGFAIGASGGWVVLGPGHRSADAALRDADRLMYEEKASRAATSEHHAYDVLVRMFREREPALGTHSEGVARLCAELGRGIELAAEDQDVLTRAAELHDVGKIAIPHEILEKAGPLDDGEWELMRRHTLIGDRMVGAIPALRPVAALIRSSHERWDGGGYPDGLAGEEIPLGSRIIAICDAFDAMTSDRPYREPVTAGEALAELRRCAGGQFDAELVARFCALVESGQRPVGAEHPAIHE